MCRYSSWQCHTGRGAKDAASNRGFFQEQEGARLAFPSRRRRGRRPAAEERISVCTGARHLLDRMPPTRDGQRLEQAAAEIGEDRISALPDELLHRVLYFLPPREAVRTCMLSPRWRKVWKSMTALRITGGGGWRRAQDFNKFVNSLLLFRDRSPLLEFEFCTYYHPDMLSNEFEGSEEVVRYVDMWIRHAFKCDVRVLKVIGMSLPRPMVLDNVPLISDRLTTLMLWSVLLDGCSMDFSRCDKLEYLMMDGCRIPPHKIFSKSLRRLCVIQCDFSKDTCTQISVPSLVSLQLDGNSGMTPFLESMPLLVTAFVRLQLTCEELYVSEECMLLEGLSNAKNLELRGGSGVTIFMQDLKWCPAFNKLNTLVLDGWVVGHDIRALICFLQHAPLLEKLILHLYDEPNYEMEMEGSYSLVEQFLPSEHLKIIEFRCREVNEIVCRFLNDLKACGITSVMINFKEPDC
ncbi:hypothetical protein ACP70R_047810 [Stipagrostis hirtigluma subsp. patula]